MSVPIWKGFDGLAEQANSPEWVFGEKVTVTQVFSGPFEKCRKGAPFRGAYIAVGAVSCRVEESRVTRDRGGKGVLTVSSLVMDLTGVTDQPQELPSEECEVEMDRMEQALERHPRYAGDVLMDYDDPTYRAPVTQTDLENIRAMLDAKNADERKKYDFLVNPGSPKFNRLAAELYRRFRMGYTHYLMFSPIYRWVQYGVLPPPAQANVYLEYPQGPITPPPGMQWLRLPDKVGRPANYWKWERVWIGAPKWDEKIYAL